mmetsp:Transcript_7928/g.12013  ORF Transcript_7928/g.12013 Transcript_7928/m.12013 type:complete len:224 (+) Transcript_7928:2-673(+)
MDLFYGIKNFKRSIASTVWILITIFLNIAVRNHWGGLRASKFTFFQRSIKGDNEYWRLITSAMLMEKLSLTQILLSLIIQFSFMSQLEKRLFDKRPTSFFLNLCMSAAIIHLPGFYLKGFKMTLTNQYFILSIAMWFGLVFGTTKVYIVGDSLGIPAIVIPFLIAGTRYIAYGYKSNQIKFELMAMAVGILLRIFFSDPEAGKLKKQRLQEKAKARDEKLNDE